MSLQPPRLPDASRQPTRLLIRSQYKSCHIQLADTPRAIAAICVDGRYYSFFKVADVATARKLVVRLQQRGDRLMLTQTPKGLVAIWVLEPDAQPFRRTIRSGSAELTASSPLRILTVAAQYRHCDIRVPDLDKSLSAICFEQRYYSLFRAVEQMQQALHLVSKLSDRRDELVITKTSEGYSLWILEPEAIE